MRRTAMRFAPAIVILALGLSATTCAARQLMFTRPPFIAQGHAYVPARELCAWLGAAVRWDGESQTIHVTWRGQEQKWSARSGIVRLRGDKAYLGIRALADAFGEPIRWRPRYRIVDFGDHPRSTYAAIPVGWKPARMTQGLSPDGREIWQLLAPLGDPEDKGRCDVRDIRVVERWARVCVHPLNFVTDDLTVLLEKREGQWRVSASGTDLFSEGRNFGIPACARRKLGLPY